MSFKITSIFLLLSVAFMQCQSAKVDLVIISDSENLKIIEPKNEVYLSKKNYLFSTKEHYYTLVFENDSNKVVIDNDGKQFEYIVGKTGLYCVNMTSGIILASAQQYGNKFLIGNSGMTTSDYRDLHPHIKKMDEKADSIYKEFLKKNVNNPNIPEDPEKTQNEVVVPTNQIRFMTFRRDYTIYGVNDNPPKEVDIRTNERRPLFYKLHQIYL